MNHASKLIWKRCKSNFMMMLEISVAFLMRYFKEKHLTLSHVSQSKI